MNKYNICLLKGDGIGPEIVNEAVKGAYNPFIYFNF